MAKRYMATGFFASPLLRGLEGAWKLLWIYINNTCDHAGIWDVELDVAGLRCGFSYDKNDCIEKFGDNIIICDGGAKWFLPSFLEDQYGGNLNPANKVHASVISILNKYSLLDEKNKPLYMPLARGMQGAKDIYMDKDKEIDKGGCRGEPIMEDDPGLSFSGWNTKPTKEDVSVLPPDTLNGIQEMLYSILQFVVPSETILQYWEGWRKTELTGEKFYASKNDVFKHFRNSIKQQRFKNEQSGNTNLNGSYKAKLAKKLAGDTGNS